MYTQRVLQQPGFGDVKTVLCLQTLLKLQGIPKTSSLCGTLVGWNT